jgi:ABC-type transport system substrate-binding protein
MSGLAWGADYAAAQNFLQLFHGPNRAPGENVSNFAIPEFDALYAQAIRLQAGAERTALHRKMQALVVDEVPWVVRYRRIQWTVRQPWISGVVPSELVPVPWAYADVDAGRRAQELAVLPR